MKAIYLIPAVLAVGVSCKVRIFNEGEGDVSAVSAVSSGGAEYLALMDKNADRFSNAVFRMFNHHDRTLHRLNDLYKSGELKKDGRRTLVHWDYHSDMYRNNSHLEGNVNIGNYINTLIWKGDIDEVWWIVPDATHDTTPTKCEKPKSQQELFWGRPNSVSDWQFRDGPGDQLICVSEAGAFTFKITGTCPGRTVKMHKRTLADVLSGKDGKIAGPTILDIDADFFDYSGRYANEGYGDEPHCYGFHEPSEAALNKTMANFMIAITDKMDLRPDYIAVSRSPGYTVERKEIIFSALEQFSKKSKSSAIEPPAK
jgi:hypothetical protein